MNVIVLGSGVYIKGKTPKELGALGSGLVESARSGLIKNVFIHSRNFNNAENTAQKLNSHLVKNNFNAIEFKDLDAESLCRFIDEKHISTAVVSLPDHIHFKYIKMCGECGLHTLTVKPFVTSLDEADELIDLFSSKNLLGCVEFHKRFDPANQLLKYKLPGIGKISRFFVDYSQDRSVPLTDFQSWAVSSNVFQYLGVHYIDLIYWLTNARPHKVHVFPSGKSLSKNGVSVDDNIDVIVEWKTNDTSFNSVHLTSWAENQENYCPSRQMISVLGEHGRIESEQADRGFRIIDSHGMSTINPLFNQKLSSQQPASDYTQIYAGYGVDSVMAFFKAVTLTSKALDIETTASNFDLCSFSDARVSVEVTSQVNKVLG